MNPRYPNGIPASQLMIVRLAIVLSVTTFTAITWFLHDSGSVTGDTSLAGPLGIVVMAVSVTLALGLFVVRALRDRAPTRSGRATFTIVAWAMGEAAALLGVVYYFLTGMADRIWPGALLLAIALLLFPIPPDN